VHRRNPDTEGGDFVFDCRLHGGGGRLGDVALGKRISDGPHLHDIEQLLGPVGREQDATRPLCRVTNADLVVDVSVRNRHVGQHEIGEVEPFQHLADNQCAGVLIGAHRIIAQRLDGRNVAAIPKRVEIDFGRSASRLGLARLAAIGHDHETHGHIADPPNPTALSYPASRSAWSYAALRP
jgi:hypothetical protein